MKYAMDSFKAKYPDIEVDEMGMEHSSYKVKLNTAMNTGSVPDVFYTLPGSYLGAFVDGGMVEPITSDLNGEWGDTIMDSALARVTYGEDIYAVPIDVDATVVWYNKALFEEKGWNTPSTAAEFNALCETIKNDGIVPIALGNKDQWPSTFWFQYPMLRLVDTGIVDAFNAGDSSASFSPEGVAAFQYIADLSKAGYFPKGVNGISAGEANMLFLNGQAAMVLNGTWQIGMTADAPDDFELGYFAFPTFAEGKAVQTDVIAGVAACFAVSKDTPNRDAAILFLQHMTSKDVAAKYVEIRKTLVTTIGAATEENAGEVLYGISSNVMENSASLDSFYDTAMPPAAVETYYTVLQGVISGDITAEEAAAQLDESMSIED
jgi:raffinose/stachyose/melibiose transport system substrate-binding protein